MGGFKKSHFHQRDFFHSSFEPIHGLAKYSLLAEVPGAARVNLQPAEHVKNVSFSL